MHGSATANDASVFPLTKPEQRRIIYRNPASLPDVHIPATPAPPTVGSPLPEDAEQPLSLDEALRTALADSEVVRTLAGVTAVSSGRTIYDPAIANTNIDFQRAAFDPVLRSNNTWSQTEPPIAVPDPADPNRALFGGVQTENYNLSAGLTQRNLSGGVSSLQFGNDASRFSPGSFLLNPQNRYGTEVSYTHPLLRGSGVCANRVPIVLARIDAERSYFQLNGAIQELVRGVIEAYWAVVFARTDVWAREIQVEQAEETVDRAEARFRLEITNVTDFALARSALANFRASLVTSRANLLQREAALQNIIGVPPTSPLRFVPVTPPTFERIIFDWNEVVEIAQVRRPDLIELKLILEADRQRLLLAENNAQPSLDLVALYRWNGLEGRMLDATRAGTNGNAATDWTLGVNFSVPLHLRADRAALRSARLLVERDRATLEQGVHAARHRLAASFRNLDQFYTQYEAFEAAREAALANLERQMAAYRGEFEVPFINVLQAISDWGNNVSRAAQSLAQYNIELANIERETGTVLETHGVFFYEDRFCALGPRCVGPSRCATYPRDLRPSEHVDQYPVGDRPAENAFDLDAYPKSRGRMNPPNPPQDSTQLEEAPLEALPPLEPAAPQIDLANPAAGP